MWPSSTPAARTTSITVEDPVEFVHQNKQSVIVHREVGDHTRSFGATLKGAMREQETIKLALSCASMGMLVFGTERAMRIWLDPAKLVEVIGKVIR